MALKQHAECDPINLGSNSQVSIKQLAETITRLAGCHLPLVFNAAQPSTIPVRVVDVTKGRDEIGFQPQIGLEDGLLDTIQWFASNRQQIMAGIGVS